jgi:hypothetical protein
MFASDSNRGVDGSSLHGKFSAPPAQSQRQETSCRRDLPIAATLRRSLSPAPITVCGTRKTDGRDRYITQQNTATPLQATAVNRAGLVIQAVSAQRGPYPHQRQLAFEATINPSDP